MIVCRYFCAIFLCLIAWIMLLSGITEAPPVVADFAEICRFPEQEQASPTEIKDGKPVADKAYVMKMINILERIATTKLGVPKPSLRWYREYVYEGDIIINKQQALQMVQEKSKRQRRKITIKPVEYWALPINYRFAPGNHTAEERDEIRAGLRHWEQQTCITFSNNDTYTDKSIVFTNDTGCWSFVGKQPGSGDQLVSVGHRCTRKGIVAHEIGHVIGFWHEHSRADRDDYVKVHSENIILGNGHNFDTKSWKYVDNLGVPYDVGSLMHYGGLTFSKDDEDLSLESRDVYLQHTMGQREELSFFDVKLANLAYCNATCNVSELLVPCRHDGYQDPKNCSRCRCPEGLAGDNCGQVAPSTGDCGGAIMLNSSSLATITSPGYPVEYEAGLRCHWLVQSPAGTTINIQFQPPYMRSVFCDASKPYLPCEDFVEVRYAQNLGLTGGRFCCDDEIQGVSYLDPITSHANHTLILFKSYQPGDIGFKLELSISSCGGCHNSVTTPQVACLRRRSSVCYHTWYRITKIQSCSYWDWFCESRFVTKAVSRPSVCYDEEKYCCDGYRLADKTPDVKHCVLHLTTETAQNTATQASTIAGTESPDSVTNSPVDSEAAHGWSEWGEWTDCDRQCGGCGTQTRERQCQGSANNCLGDGRESRPCNLQSCNMGSIQKTCANTKIQNYSCGILHAQSCTRNVTQYFTQSANCCCGYELQDNSLCLQT